MPERNISIPGRDENWGTAGWSRLFVCLCVCLCVCLFVPGWVGRPSRDPPLPTHPGRVDPALATHPRPLATHPCRPTRGGSAQPWRPTPSPWRPRGQGWVARGGRQGWVARVGRQERRPAPCPGDPPQILDIFGCDNDGKLWENIILSM